MDADKYAWFEDNEVHLVKDISDSHGHFSMWVALGFIVGIILGIIALKVSTKFGVFS
ncbi:MAG: hypothetical protein ACI8XB_001088 [Patiriisocius sp.]|jgi:hypothetical protein